MLSLNRSLTVHCVLQQPSWCLQLHKLYSRKVMRNKRGRHPNYGLQRPPNPGMQRQLKLYENTQPPGDKKQPIDENFEDNLESDFMSAGKVYDQHQWEQDQQKEFKHLKNVGRKYFKEEKMPSLLTWAEKEQIRYLHGTDSEEWCVERLAVSFPATETIIKKVLKSSWKPENAAYILKHDANVKKNWNLLAEGKLDLPPGMKAHVSKFTSRQDLITSEAGTNAVIPSPQKPKGRVPEFENIIKQYNDLIEKNDEIKNLDCKSSSSTKDERVLYSRKLFEEKALRAEKRNITFNEYKRNDNSKYEMNDVQTAGEPGTEVIHLEDTSPVKFRTKNSNVQKYTFDASRLQGINDDFMEKIKIPKNKWQEGATYKIKDCYYDDDGRFLYRVPGMVSELKESES